MGKCGSCTVSCGNDWCAYKDDVMEKPSLFNITLEEAFEFGRMEGSKETLKEVIELADSEPAFIKKYCQARLTSLNEYPKILSIKRGLN